MFPLLGQFDTWGRDRNQKYDVLLCFWRSRPGKPIGFSMSAIVYGSCFVYKALPKSVGRYYIYIYILFIS